MTHDGEMVWMPLTRSPIAYLMRTALTGLSSGSWLSACDCGCSIACGLSSLFSGMIASLLLCPLCNAMMTPFMLIDVTAPYVHDIAMWCD